jgi:antitoxin component YwqK of YwqJK toxin-antitoxin module
MLFWLVGPWRQPRKEEQSRELPRSDLVLREGRLYRIGSTNRFTGSMVEFYANHALKSRCAISNGLLHGLSEGWHTNGQLQVREEFKEGFSQGLRTKWYADGKKLSEASIVDGKLQGTFRRWHENGSLAEQVEMQSGNPEGWSWAYYPSGFLKAQVRLQGGKPLDQRFWKDGETKAVGPTAQTTQ